MSPLARLRKAKMKGLSLTMCSLSPCSSAHGHGGQLREFQVSPLLTGNAPLACGKMIDVSFGSQSPSPEAFASLEKGRRSAGDRFLDERPGWGAAPTNGNG